MANQTCRRNADLKCVLAVLALLTLVGCQGVSGGGSTNQQQPPATGDLALNHSSLNFGSVNVGSSAVLTVTATNNGSAAATISAAKFSVPQFSLKSPALPVTVSAGQSATFSLVFAPTAAGNISGNMTVSSDASDSTVTASLSGTGQNLTPGSPGVLTPNPSSLNFGNIQVGNSQTLNEAVTNTGESDVNIASDTLTGTGYTVNNFSPPVTLTAGQSYTFSVTYAPQTTGSAPGNILISSDASDPSLNIPLSGQGMPPTGTLAISPTTLNFNNVVVGTSGNQTATLIASGTGVTVTAYNFSNAQFSLSGLTMPATVQPGNNVSFTVTFTPQTTGPASGTLSFTSTATNSPTILSLTGNGTPPPVHSVALSWTPSNSPDIASYNIYRSTSPNTGYVKIGSVNVPSAAYTDNSVTDGVTYYYVATAVNTTGEESTHSNQATAPIPPP